MREGEQKPGRRRDPILVGNGGLYLPQELRRGADGAMTGFAWPEMLVQVCALFATGKAAEAEDLFDIYLPLVRHGGAAGDRPPCARRSCSCAAIKSLRQRAPGSSLTATSIGPELGLMIARLEHRLAASGRTHKLGGGVSRRWPITI